MDELCQRRQYWKNRYVEWINNSTELSSDDIESSLHDTWSEVRYDSFKSLKKAQENMSTQQLLLLGRNLLIKINIDGSSHSWQTIHGSILGLNAICYFLIRCDQNERDTFHNDVIKSCLTIVTHDMLPIREATRECIIEYLKVLASYSSHYQKYCDFTMSVLNTLKSLSMLKFLDERCASSFDGLLGCLVDIIQHSKYGLQIYNYFDDKEYDDTSDLIFLHNQNLFLKCTITCFNHEASTVRQRAASVLLSLYKLKSDDNIELQTKMKDGILNVLQDCVVHCINEEHIDHWKILETCLIISEDVTTYEMQSFFNVLKANDGKDARVSSSFLRVLGGLRQSLPFTILNSQFELRRMGSQLLPTLARATLLFDVQNIYDDELIKNTNEYDDAYSKKTLLTSCVWCGWTSEITKAIQYLLEYFVPQDKYALTLKNYSPTSYVGLGIWANKVRGRLSEEDARLLYNVGLQDVKNCGNYSSSSLTDIMIHSMKQLSLLHKNVIISCSRKLFSVDFCEASILSFVVMSWNLHLVSSEVDPSTVPLDAFKRAICQILQLECLSTPSNAISLLIEWLDGKISLLDYGFHYQYPQQRQSPNWSTSSPSSAKNRSEDVLLLSSITDPMVPLFENGTNCAPPSPKNTSSSHGSNSSICRRWLCEAISPILPTLAVLAADNIEIVTLVVIVSLWIEDLCADGLWFDRKVLAKRSLVESLPMLIDNAIRYLSFKNHDNNMIIIGIINYYNLLLLLLYLPSYLTS